MSNILHGFSTRHTPQSHPASPKQSKNAAGGYTFQVDDWQRLRRFLVLGSVSGTYYTGAADLTRENAELIVRLAENDHSTLINEIVHVSIKGSAPKNDYALFALAIAASHGTAEEKTDALALLPKVARTGSHLLQFASYIEQFRGWGRGLRRAVGSWYTSKTVDSLAYQTVKYRNRHGWTHRDLLRLAHPVTADPELRSAFGWIAQNTTDELTPALIEGFTKAQESGADIVKLVGDYPLSWEMLPDEALNRPDVWEALLGNDRVPLGALIRQLPRLTRIGLLSPFGGVTRAVASRIEDQNLLTKARIHPMNVLVAHRTYASGHSLRGSTTWEPSTRIVDALDDAYYKAYGNVEPANKRTMIGLDVSGSMSWGAINNMPLTPREASAAMALVTLATEPETMTLGFTGGGGGLWGRTREPVTQIPLSPRQRLSDAIDLVSDLPFGPTDCSAPVEYARENSIGVDTFVIYTDNETWAGRTHPHQALEAYRQQTGIDAKMIVVGMTATDASIANPDDPGMLDIAGFDTAVPNLITEFSKGL